MGATRSLAVLGAACAIACSTLVGIDQDYTLAEDAGSGGTESGGGTAATSASGASGGSGATGAGGAAGGSGATGGTGATGATGATGGIGGGDSGADASGGAPPIAIVQVSETMLSTVAVPTLMLKGPPGAGNSIIVGITCISDYLADCTIAASGVTDNHGNAYTRIVQGEPIKSSALGARGYLFIAQNIVSPASPFVISVDPDGTPGSQQVAWGAIEVSGLAAPPSLDASGISLVGGTGVTSTTATTDLATVQPNELAVAVLSMRSDDTNLMIEPEPSWTPHHIHQNNASGPPGHSMVSKLLTGTGKIGHTWTHDTPTRGVAAIIATFKGATKS